MSFLRRANTVEIERVDHPTEDAWIDLRSELTKGEMNRIATAAPTEENDRAGMLTLIEKFADIVVKDWSMSDEQGSHVPFSIAEYRKLGVEGAKWVDSVLAEHLGKVLGSEVKEIEGKPSN